MSCVCFLFGAQCCFVFYGITIARVCMYVFGSASCVVVLLELRLFLWCDCCRFVTFNFCFFYVAGVGVDLSCHL